VGHYGVAAVPRDQRSGRISRRVVRTALPIVTGVLAFTIVGYLSGRRRERGPAADALLNQPIDNLAVRNVPLQVAIHDLIESAPGEAAVRVCRSLADRPVSVEMAHTEPLHAVIERLAAQVGVAPVPTIGQQGHRVLLTIPCPDGPGDYLVIGSQTRAGR
jgi:hypothetical protein